ncbi:hypothetical protein SAMD00019534_052790 [Acytostelium subglobosum LB1]|uniref:hypothetical protein n=1 Tax=Acytostelium subglobosum LB1 TaxID=1410327 RepID=UPI000644F190|nr:hypothetical protein SAMD00019534_052790 [Acytostelium subglobosum LB1]GAM22104.1 hypothetical protein SAMD00019534_052790 [Acytostelium subglobosum LB1]|eukprot:XP_012755204.1 hypothetical protein SAMD00019534_052790 [Acytostelium subglobosum LB1]
MFAPSLSEAKTTEYATYYSSNSGPIDDLFIILILRFLQRVMGLNESHLDVWIMNYLIMTDNTAQVKEGLSQLRHQFHTLDKYKNGCNGLLFEPLKINEQVDTLYGLIYSAANVLKIALPILWPHEVLDNVNIHLMWYAAIQRLDQTPNHPDASSIHRLNFLFDSTPIQPLISTNHIIKYDYLKKEIMSTQ